MKIAKKNIRLQNVLVIIIYYLGFSRIKNIIFRILKIPETVIITFHDILPEDIGTFYNKLYFLKNNTNVIDIGDYRSNRLSTTKINIIITFDDGYKSWVSNVLPVLKKMKLPAIFFISSGFVDLCKEDEEYFIRTNLLINIHKQKVSGCLSLEDVKMIVNEGFSIGGHTINHRILSNILCEKEAKYEIVEDKKRLEKIVEKKIEYFAYPSGVYYNSNINIEEILIRYGYKGAVTTKSGFNTKNTAPYLLHRELTRASMNNQEFKARVYGNTSVLNIIKNLYRK